MKAQNTQMVDCSPYAEAYIYTHIYIYIYIQTCMHTCINANKSTYVHTFIHSHLIDNSPCARARGGEGTAQKKMQSQ